LFEGLWRLEALADFDTDNGDLGICSVYADDGAGADGSALVARVIEDPPGAGLHLAEIFDGGGIGDAIPVGFFVAEEVVEGVGVGLGFEEEAGGHGDHGMRRM